MKPNSNIRAKNHDTSLVLQELLRMIDKSFLHDIQQYALDEMVRLTDSQAGFSEQNQGLNGSGYWTTWSPV